MNNMKKNIIKIILLDHMKNDPLFKEDDSYLAREINDIFSTKNQKRELTTDNIKHLNAIIKNLPKEKKENIKHYVFNILHIDLKWKMKKIALIDKDYQLITKIIEHSNKSNIIYQETNKIISNFLDLSNKKTK